MKPPELGVREWVALIALYEREFARIAGLGGRVEIEARAAADVALSLLNDGELVALDRKLSAFQALALPALKRAKGNRDQLAMW